MKIYIASRWNRKRSLQLVRNAFLADTDVQVTSTWIDAERPDEIGAEFFLSEDGMRRMTQDFADIDAADILVADVLDGMGRRGGMMIEMGYALGRGKPVILIGNPAQFGVFGNMFVHHFPDWHTAIHGFFSHVK